jgi:hypothetical protein
MRIIITAPPSIFLYPDLVFQERGSSNHSLSLSTISRLQKVSVRAVCRKRKRGEFGRHSPRYGRAHPDRDSAGETRP